MKLERHETIPQDLREHWVNIQRITGPGNIRDKVMYREDHQLRRLHRVVELAANYGFMDCLELGCCEGSMTVELAKNFQVVTAVDFVPELLNVCPDLPNVTYQLKDIETWTTPIPHEVIVMSELLEHVRDPKDLVQRFAVKAQFIIATCPTNEELNPQAFNADLIHGFNQNKLLEVGSAAGHVWAMDHEGFRSLFDGLEIVHEEVDASTSMLVVRGSYP